MMRPIIAAAACSIAAARAIAGDWIVVNIDDSNVCDVTAYGAVADGKTDSTKAFQTAINECSSGGEVVVPGPGVYMTWNVATKKAVNFGINVQAGAVWKFFNDTSSPIWNGAKDVIVLDGVSSAAMYGGGTIDGNGAAWWPTPDAYRPGLVYASGVEFLIKDLTFMDSPNHQLQLYTDNTEVVDTNIFAPASTASPPSHNTDGIDTHGNYHYYHRLNITTGDDNVAFHANHTLVEDCYFGTGHGTSIGSLGAGTGALVNITVRDVRFIGTTQAIRIKADCGSTGSLSAVTYGPNITCQGVGQTIFVTAFYPSSKSGPCSGTPSTLAISDVTFTGITSADAGTAGQLWCDDATPCTGMVFKDVVHTGSTEKGWDCQAFKGHASHVTPALPSGCLSA